MERIAGGFALAEAPVAAPDGGVWFSDAVGGGAYRWSPGSDEVETVIPKRRGIGGMARHAAGGLVVSGRDVSRIDGALAEVLYADPTAAGFNDLTVDPDGRVVAGVLRFHPFKGEDPAPGEFARLETEAPRRWCWAVSNGPTGAASPRTARRSTPVTTAAASCAQRTEEGAYRDARELIASPSGEADGLAVDENGGIWVALGGGGAIGRFRPDGELEAMVDVPAPFVASLCFGGDGRDLFVTTTGDPGDPDAPGGVYLARAPVAGVPVPAVA